MGPTVWLRKLLSAAKDLVGLEASVALPWWEAPEVEDRAAEAAGWAGAAEGTISAAGEGRLRADSSPGARD